VSQSLRRETQRKALYGGMKNEALRPCAELLSLQISETPKKIYIYIKIDG